MAHKKAGGSTRNGRDSQSKRLGLKKFGGEAVKAGKFRVYAVGKIDEGIEVLTGVPAGERDGEGKYPAGSVNDLVEQKLGQFTEQQKKNAAAINAERDSTPSPDRSA